MNKIAWIRQSEPNMYESIKQSSRIVLWCPTKCIFGWFELFTQEKMKIIGIPTGFLNQCLKRFQKGFDYILQN